MIVTVFGDIDPEEALTLVKKLFGGLKPAPGFQPIPFDRGNAIAETVVRHKSIGKQTAMVLFGYPTASIFEKEDYAAMTLLDAIVSGYTYPGGWLHNELRGEGLVYFVHAFQTTGPAPGYFENLAQTRPDKVDEVVARIERNVERAKAGRIDEDEFRTAVQMVTPARPGNTTIASRPSKPRSTSYGLGYDYHKPLTRGSARN